MQAAQVCSLNLLDYFTPANWAFLDEQDLDLGVSGAMLLPGTNLVVGGSKTGDIFVLNRDKLGNLRMYSSRFAYFIDWQNKKLNEEKTRALFQHPIGGYPKSKIKGKPTEFYEGYRPIGQEIDIFSFQGKYYFDVFFDTWGDFEGKRRKDKKIRETLGVFYHEDNVTKQVCEYHWNESSKF